MRGDQPIVRIFARGYVPLVANNLTPGVAQDLARAPSRMQSRLNGQTMRLTAHRGSLADYSRALIPLRHSLDFAFEGTHCEWKQAPLMFVEFDRIRRELQKSGIDSELPLLEHLGGQAQCGNALEYFKELERR